MQKVRYLCCSKLPPSKLHKLCRLVELYEAKYNEPIETTDRSQLNLTEYKSDKTFLDLTRKGADYKKEDLLAVLENEVNELAVLREYGIIIP